MRRNDWLTCLFLLFWWNGTHFHDVTAFAPLSGRLSPSFPASATSTPLISQSPSSYLSSSLSDSAASSSSGSRCPTTVNEFFKRPVPKVLQNALALTSERMDDDVVSVLTAAPGSPVGVPRPLWITLLGSLSTGLCWYGYYKFCVEEELLQLELTQQREPRGLGGYGTLGSFSLILFPGLVAYPLDLQGATSWLFSAAVFIWWTQCRMNDRVNDLYKDEGLDPPLQTWWWSLPICFPLNAVVGLRQVHFLSQYHYRRQGRGQGDDAASCRIPADPVADLFPFVRAKRFTWQKLFLTPRMWCSLLKDVEDIGQDQIPTILQPLLAKV